MSGPLTGVKVVDLSSMLSGPWAPDPLGNQGADVIKIEPAGNGDHVRAMGNQCGGMSAMFNINRSKRSLTLNPKSAEGVEVLKALSPAGSDRWQTTVPAARRPTASRRRGRGSSAPWTS